MSDGTRPWGGKNATERSTERRARLFNAALDLAESDGIGAITVRGVCAQARLTARYFYESFADTPDLLTSLYDHLSNEGIAAITGGIDSAIIGANAATHTQRDPFDPLATLVQAGMAFMVDDPRACRFLLIHAAADPLLHRRRRDAITDLGRRLTEIWSTVVADSPSLVSSGLAARFGLGGLIEFATAYLEGELHLTQEQCAEAGLNLLRAFVTAEGALHSAAPSHR